MPCFADNVVLLGLASDVLAAQHDLEAQLCRDLNATPNLKESYFYAPAWTADGLTMGTIPAAFRNTAARVAPDLAARLDAIIRLEGITVLGYPLGTDDYCRSVLHKLNTKIHTDLPTLERLDDGLAYSSGAPPTRRARPHPLPMGWDDRRTGPDQRQMPVRAGTRPL